jgi:hypothetical protein
MKDDNQENTTKKRQMNPNSLANLRTTGNPKGRPKLDDALKKRIRGLTPVAIDTLETIMKNAKAKDSDRIKASEVILDRAWGKATQPIDADVNAAVKVMLPPGLEVLAK